MSKQSSNGQYEAGFFQEQSHLIASNKVQLYYGATISDIDRDGHLEIFITGFGFGNVVLKWDGTQYQNIADATLADHQRQAIGVATADIDGDGHEEIYVLNTDTFGGAKRFGDRLFTYQDGVWTDLFSLPENQKAINPTAGRSVVAVDRNSDQKYGFFVANYGGPMRLYEYANDQLQEVATEASLNLTTGGRGLISLPLLGKDMDIFAVNENGPNFFFQNQGDGTFQEIALKLGLADPFNHGRGVTVLDSTGDGLLDIIYGNWEGLHRLMIQQKQGGFRDEIPNEMKTASHIRTVIAADFDNDGQDELFFNNINQANRLFRKENNLWKEVALGMAAEPQGFGTGATVGDVDEDGILELFVTHGESQMQALSLYKATQAYPNWVRVMPLTRYGAPARGAIVRLHTAQKSQIKVIDAGSGYLCQMEPVAHFGLGEETAVKAIEITWPGGAKMHVEHPEIKRLHRIPFPN